MEQCSFISVQRTARPAQSSCDIALKATWRCGLIFVSLGHHWQFVSCSSTSEAKYLTKNKYDEIEDLKIRALACEVTWTKFNYNYYYIKFLLFIWINNWSCQKKILIHICRETRCFILIVISEYNYLRLQFF